jgi:hypothetical protein
MIIDHRVDAHAVTGISRRLYSDTFSFVLSTPFQSVDVDRYFVFVVGVFVL